MIITDDKLFMTKKSQFLVIALGNPLRGDDSAAHTVADRVHALTEGEIPVIKRTFLDICDLPYVKSLNPSVLFIVDACRMHLGAEGFLMTLENDSEPQSGFIHHAIHPGEYGDIAALFGCSPEIYKVLISGERFEHSAALSSYALRNAEAAADEILTIIHNKRCDDDKNFPVTREW